MVVSDANNFREHSTRKTLGFPLGPATGGGATSVRQAVNGELSSGFLHRRARAGPLLWLRSIEYKVPHEAKIEGGPLSVETEP